MKVMRISCSIVNWITTNIILKGRYYLMTFVKFLILMRDIFEDVRGESETLAGLMLELTGEIPQIGTDSALPGIYVQNKFCRQEKDKRDLC